LRGPPLLSEQFLSESAISRFRVPFRNKRTIQTPSLRAIYPGANFFCTHGCSRRPRDVTQANDNSQPRNIYFLFVCIFKYLNQCPVESEHQTCWPSKNGIMRAMEYHQFGFLHLWTPACAVMTISQLIIDRYYRRHTR